MLELRPNCECCDTDLPYDAKAYICTYECTFCQSCSQEKFKGTCPNCGGNFTVRPIRPKHLIHKNPPSEQRFTKAHSACQSEGQ